MVAFVWLALAATHAQVPDPRSPAPNPVAPSAQPQTGPSPRNANYRIRARLDTEARTISGTETITWRNPASIPASTLQFHLYYNAWRNTESTWMRERILGGDSSLASRPEADWGWTNVSAMRVRRAVAVSDVFSQ